MPENTSPSTGETSQWRFDAVDLRAGLAFAAWRKDLADDPSPGEVQAVHFSPPSFLPEPVANGALALGATRGSLRPGLAVNGREIWFERLEEAGEFLRRAYVVSGGGDGGDGPGDDDPSPPLPEPPDLPNRPEGDSNSDEAATGRGDDGPLAAEALASFAKEIQEKCFRLDPGKSEEVYWHKGEFADALPALQAAATYLMRELLMRRPRTEPDEYLPWLRDFRLWWASVCNLGLRPLVLGDREGASILHAWAQQELQAMIPQYPFVPALVVASLLRGDMRLKDAFREAGWPDEIFIHSPRLYPWSHDFISPSTLSAATLRRLPLPDWAWTLVGKDLQGRASLYHLLCTLTTQPQLTTDQRHFKLLLFACACVVAAKHGISEPRPLFWQMRNDEMSDVEVADARRIARDATEWLREHLPTRAFSKGYEEVISGAKDIRYRASSSPT